MEDEVPSVVETLAWLAHGRMVVLARVVRSWNRVFLRVHLPWPLV